MSYIGYVPAAKPLTSADITDSVVTSAKIVDGTIAIADLSATGTPSSTTFLRGDNTWGSAGATAGQVIQVLQGTDTTQRSSTSTSFNTASNTCTVTITPSSTSNKILLLACIQKVGGDQTVYFTIYRGATNLGNASYGFDSAEGTASNANCIFNYLDSPASTSALTYQIYMRVTSGSAGYNFNTQNSLSSLTAMEVKG